MIANRRVLAVITARGASKGVPGKNLKTLAGCPLIEWSILAARGSKYIDRLILSSEDAEIIAVARGLKCEVPFVRSAALAADSTPSVDVVLDAVNEVPGYDIVVLLQPTSPLRTADDIDCTLVLLHDAPAAVTATNASTHPWLVYSQTPDGKLLPYVAPNIGASLRRQDLPAAVQLNGAVYAADICWLRKNRAFVVRDQTRVWIMPEERSVDIDTLYDFETAERVMIGLPTLP